MLNITERLRQISVWGFSFTADLKAVIALTLTDDRSHALRGNAARDAPRPCDAERHLMHSHAERGNDLAK
ncbi:hypothetical protein CT157_21960 [Pseudomonas syringae]|uniref:DUF1534 domain-containing protein n=1 Tax=Pseudomonas syringae TaxID=317 RepID=A0A3T0JYN1_PSESX|nr:hypothetical protein CT157_21960 [Pseudomonas syringae]